MAIAATDTQKLSAILAHVNPTLSPAAIAQLCKLARSPGGHSDGEMRRKIVDALTRDGDLELPALSKSVGAEMQVVSRCCGDLLAERVLVRLPSASGWHVFGLMYDG